ncbi:rhodanese-like domain-containing protein [Jeotgalibacillus proteolyticus]|uniref:Rhodanese n=1 Tax=Jeotgalibacillus proteolyticus TaxID=2082395 RepID=A0A2S5GDF1_9BACL|nr:rhodanese-like domain-containing protein [Jeotgalibacillus proteolyticus]PPA70941.1 rhodanese [Jeotgalibacillus proteolyticus]
MGTVMWIGATFLLLVFVVKKMIPVKGINHITADELQSYLIQRDKHFIDVRTPGEYKRGYIHGFKNIPLNDLSSHMDELDKNKEVLVMCQSGMRSMKGASSLKKHGFLNVTNVKGGMTAWKGKVEKG